MVFMDVSGRAGAAAAPMPAGTSAIAGQVIDAAGSGGRPVAGALVTLRLPGFTPLRVLADAQGRFAFADLPKGGFSIEATKPGYLAGSFGRTRPNGPAQSVTLNAGATVSDATIVVWKFGAIAGTVVDEVGQPMVGVTVRALRRSLSGGRPQYINGPSDTTDDRGMYRIHGLVPGEYVVTVPIGALSTLAAVMTSGGGRGLPRIGTLMQEIVGTPMPGGGMMMRIDSGPRESAGRRADGRVLIYENWFYPSTTNLARAAAVAIVSGDDRGGIDFQLTPVTAARISGTVTGPDGPAANTLLELRPVSSDIVAPLLTALTLTDASGTFTFAAVPEGQYVLRARTGAPAGLVTAATRIELPIGGPTPAAGSARGMVTVDRSVVLEPSGGPSAPPTMIGIVTGPAGPASGGNLWADVPLTVDSASIDDVAVVLRPGVTASGTVEWSGTAPRPAPAAVANVVARLEAAEPVTARNGSPARGAIDAAGVFTVRGLLPGRYVLRVSNLPSGWFLHSATAAGQDIVDQALEIGSADLNDLRIILRDRPGGDLNGIIAGATRRGADDSPLTVVIFPEESGAWRDYGSAPRRLRSTTTDRGGAFGFTNVPPGRYYAAAVTDQDADRWQDPAFLEQLRARSAPIEVREGARATVTVEMPR
jgi:hypothetical protein